MADAIIESKPDIEHLEREWYRILDQIESIPDAITLNLSVGRKSITLLYMLMSTGTNFKVFMVNVENRHSSTVTAYKTKIITILTNLHMTVNIKNIICNGRVNGWCPRMRCMSIHRMNDKNIHLSGWNGSGWAWKPSQDNRNKNILYPFFGLSDETAYALYSRYVPNLLRPDEHISIQCVCPYGLRG